MKLAEFHPISYRIHFYAEHEWKEKELMIFNFENSHAAFDYFADNF